MVEFDWQLIRSFLSVIDAGSLAAAAKKSGASQPTLGRHIDELEKKLGASLFQRGRAGMVPTETGLAIIENARTASDSIAAISMAAIGQSESLSGNIRITASDIMATHIMPEILSRLLISIPDIEVELVASNTQENLLQRDADIAIRMVRPTQNDLIAKKIGDLQLGIYVHKDYAAKNGVPTTIEEMSGHVFIGYDRSDLIIDGFRNAGVMVDRHFFRFRCDNQNVCFQALLAGVGIGFMPTILAGNYQSLVRIVEPVPIAPLPIWLVSHREVQTSAKIRAVFDFLSVQLSEKV